MIGCHQLEDKCWSLAPGVGALELACANDIFNKEFLMQMAKKVGKVLVVEALRE